MNLYNPLSSWAWYKVCTGINQDVGLGSYFSTFKHYFNNCSFPQQQLNSFPTLTVCCKLGLVLGVQTIGDQTRVLQQGFPTLALCSPSRAGLLCTYTWPSCCNVRKGLSCSQVLWQNNNRWDTTVNCASLSSIFHPSQELMSACSSQATLSTLLSHTHCLALFCNKNLVISC